MKKQISMTTVFLFLVLFTIFTVAPFILAHFDVEISSAVNNYNAENVREEDQSSSDFMNDLPIDKDEILKELDLIENEDLKYSSGRILGSMCTPVSFSLDIRASR